MNQPRQLSAHWIGRATRLSLAVAFLAPALYAQQQPAKTPSSKPPAIKVDQGAWSGDFDEMIKRRYLRVAVPVNKTLYYVVNGVQHGACYEIMKEFETFINRKFPYQNKSLRFHVVFRPANRAEILSLVVRGNADLAMGTISVTAERQKQVDFTDPTATNTTKVAVTGPKSPALHTLDDLAGQEVFVRKTSSAWRDLEELNAKLKKEGKAEVRLTPAPEDLEDDDLLEMLNAGLVSIVVTDAYLPKAWSKVYTAIQSHPDMPVHEGGEFGWAMRKNSPKLMAVANEFIKTHKQGTAYGNALIARYVSPTRMLKNVAAPEQLKKFQATVGFFKKYGDQYNMDYLLMMAQGFQESTLNQAAQSPVGAIGVMQLMPATGEQMKAGDIHQEESNIHAGVKYIRFMVDKYFANEPMTDTDKVLFAFAAYNCGPGKVHSLRVEAGKRGLDPNKWLYNVDVVAADKIGMETVTYVANIYKYYVAYKLVAEQEAEKAKAMGKPKS